MSDGPGGPRGRGYYSFDIGSWHIVALNSNQECTITDLACDVGSAQVDWLRADLAAHPAPCTLAYFHHPRFQQGTVHGDQIEVAGFWNALYDAGADVVLSAHEHNYQQFAPMDPAGLPDPTRGLREFVVGTGGAGLYTTFNNDHAASLEMRDSAHFGIIELTLHPASYDWRVLSTDGVVLSAGSDTCH